MPDSQDSNTHYASEQRKGMSEIIQSEKLITKLLGAIILVSVSGLGLLGKNSLSLNTHTVLLNKVEKFIDAQGAINEDLKDAATRHLLQEHRRPITGLPIASLSPYTPLINQDF